MKKLLFCLILIIGISGCASCPIDTKIGPAKRPWLLPITAEQQARTPVDVLDIIAVNQEELKTWGLKNEKRILIHDESL